LERQSRSDAELPDKKTPDKKWRIPPRDISLNDQECVSDAGDYGEARRTRGLLKFPMTSRPLASHRRPPRSQAAQLPRLRLPSILLGLVLVALLPTLAFGVAATWYAVTGERAAAEGRLRDTAQALALAVDQQLNASLAALNVLATSPAFGPNATTPDLPALYAQARRVAEQLGVVVFVVARDGSHVLTTRKPLGTPLQPVASIDLVERVFLTRRPIVGDLAPVPVADRLIFAGEVPVHRTDGTVALVIGALFEVEKLRDLLRAASMPAGAMAAVSDAKGIIVARSDSLHSARVGHPITAENARAIGGKGEGLYRTLAVDGMERVFAFHKLSAAPGWTLVVGQPASAFDSAWRTPLLMFGGGAASALALGMCLVSMAARQILVPLRQLGMHARVVASSGGAATDGISAGTLPPARVAELEELRRGFVAAEGALRRNADELTALFQASPIGIARVDLGGRVYDANDGLLRMLGTTHEDLTAGLVRWDALSSTEFLPAQQQAVAEALAAPDGRCRPYETAFVRPDGKRVPALVSITVLDRASGEAAAFVMDLTEIRHHEARLQLFVDKAPAAIAMFDKDMRYVAASQRFLSDYRIRGETVQSLCGRSHYEVFPDIPEPWHEIHRRVLAGETLSAHDDLFVRQDGHTDWVRWEMTPWYQADCSVGGAILFSEVMTARKTAEAALAQNEARLRGLMDAVAEGIILASEDGRIISANPSIARMFGYAAESELVGQPLTMLMPKLEAVRHDCYLANHRTTGETRVIGVPGRQLIACRKDGSEFPLDLSVNSFRSGDTRYFTGVLRDITDRKRAEAVERHAEELERLVRARTLDLEETQAQLLHAVKMEALGQLAGGVAHDFNNVLQTLEGSVTLASKRLQTDPAAAQSYLAIATAAVDRGVTVTGRLLAFARRGELSAAPIAALPLLENVAQLLRHSYGPAVTLQVEAEPTVPALFADIGQLESVLVNLANNARDALVKGVGAIRLTATAVAPRDAPPELAPGSYVRLSVVDDGSGMSSDVLAHVTEAFFTTKPKGQGTGLGLAIARGFTERSGGALTIESALGQGTTVSLWLPVVPAEAIGDLRTDETSYDNNALPQRRTAILFVDDEPALRTVLAALLTDQGDVVTEAEDAAVALTLIDSGLAVDVLVTDLGMPGDLDGLGLIREARRRLPGLPAVLVTGYPGEAADTDIQQAAASGPFALLRKPFSVKMLQARVAALLLG
jgi:PAS domain S-box-containing protein